VFDLLSNHDAQVDAEKLKVDDDGGVDEDNELYSSDTSSTSLNSTAPLIYFPTLSTSLSSSSADEGEGLVVPLADGPRKKPVVLHSPHSFYSFSVLATHDQRLYAVSDKSIVGNTRDNSTRHDTTRIAHDTTRHARLGGLWHT